MRLLPFLALVLLGCVHQHHGAEYEGDDDTREDRHPIDHFTTKVVFRTTLWTPESPDEAKWPKPGSSVELAEVSCAISDSKTGTTVRCVPGFALEKKFAALLHDDTPLGKAMKDRLAQCYDVHPKTWTRVELARYETALHADPGALPPALGDDWVIAYVGHDDASFLASCKPEPDGTCVYTATQQPEATVEERVARGGKAASMIPFAPQTLTLALTFFDGHQPYDLARVPLPPTEHEQQRETDVVFDPTKVAWDPVLAWHAANEPSSANFAVALVLAGRLHEARAVGGVDAIDRDDLLTKDPCAKGSR